MIAANLKPMSFMGTNSHGMVVCASGPNKSAVEILEPPEGSTPGERIIAEGHDGPPASGAQMKKKKVLEALWKDATTTPERVVQWNSLPLTTSKGPVTAKSIVGGTIG